MKPDVQPDAQPGAELDVELEALSDTELGAEPDIEPDTGAGALSLFWIVIAAKDSMMMRPCSVSRTGPQASPFRWPITCYLSVDLLSIPNLKSNCFSTEESSTTAMTKNVIDLIP